MTGVRWSLVQESGTFGLCGGARLLQVVAGELPHGALLQGVFLGIHSGVLGWPVPARRPCVFPPLPLLRTQPPNNHASHMHGPERQRFNTRGSGGILLLVR